MNGRENELVICSPGNEEAPSNRAEIDPRKHSAFWTGNGWSSEYPDALTWAGDDPWEEFLVADARGNTTLDIDEDAYENYLEEEFKRAKKELLETAEIPSGAYIEIGVGFNNNSVVYTK